MEKISIIIRREFSTRVRKKSFIVMTILGPFLFAAMIFLPMFFALHSDGDVKIIAVADSSQLFENKIPDSNGLVFKFQSHVNLNNLLKNFEREGYWGVLYISPNVDKMPGSVILYSKAQAGIATTAHIENALKKEAERQILLAHNLEGLDAMLEAAKNRLNIKSIKIEDDGAEKESNSVIAMVIGYISGFLIYFFILLFGTQVMRGVIEEKSNRIVEVIVSSVKPFELMMGKIIGIAGVALLQFALWAVLTLGIITIGQQAFFKGNANNNIQNIENPTNAIATKQITGANNFASNVPDTDKNLVSSEIFKSLQQFNFGFIIFSFLFFFIGGYLLYASLFAIVGSAVDNDADTQQFILPVTIPLILAIYIMISTINNPEGTLSFWFSYIPLTSPIVMMVRIPFGVSWVEVVISMIILVASFITSTWVAAKIYRTGILMYGKKISYKELYKWLKY